MPLQLADSAVDAAIGRLLFVAPAPSPALDGQELDPVASRAFSVSLLFSATRCTVMYIVLPFLLPFVGIVGRPPVPLLMACDLAALCGIVYSLRRLWRLHSPGRWRYLPLACIAILVMSVFLVTDIASAGI